MKLNTTTERRNRYVNQSAFELQQTNHSPIFGYEDQRLLTLEEAVDKILPSIDNNINYIICAKQECYRSSDLLSVDESAAIYLYTMSTPLFKCLNNILRSENRHELKPWFPFLKLFMSGLNKLPSSTVTVWRAVSGNMGSFSTEDNVKIWWSVNSSTTALNIIELYLGESGTLFAIEAVQGKDISLYSAFPEEQEVILMPGTCLRIKCEPCNFIDRLLVVHLKEVIIQHEIQCDSVIAPNGSPDNNSIDDPLLCEHDIAFDDTQGLLQQRLRRCHFTRRTLVGTLAGVILLSVGIIYIVLSNTIYKSTFSSTSIKKTIPPLPTTTMEVKGTSLTSINANKTSSSTSNDCFSVGWKSVANIVANGALFYAFTVDDDFNIYATNGARFSLDIWSPNDFTPEKVLNDTIPNIPHYIPGADCLGLYVTSVGDIFILSQNTVVKWLANSSIGVLIADGNADRDDSVMSDAAFFLSFAVDEISNTVYVLDRSGFRLLKYTNTSQIGTIVFNSNTIEDPFDSRSRIYPMMMNLDKNGYFLLAELSKITMFTSDGKFRTEALSNYETVQDSSRKILSLVQMKFDRMGNLYCADYKYIVKFNRTNNAC
ncbi:unnamed protein product [Adineta steineri]|uniref:NAD(P)(+)--arginine ADP-ribosyltransferase n=1 Tax=Adineta steineri TaxID=433720 RepID=A0A815P837_9BILA|nr:unnamed protein product [Adineta steineri]CAF1445422.1 unnamed protein product [Adineta steineri]CAF3596969.1 unnamed protein product [Adineta steineri]CAF3741782.1 unnamed protein product [Adineta steineri]